METEIALPVASSATRYFAMRLGRCLAATILLVLVAGCKGDPPTASVRPGDFVLRFQVVNQLLAPITIAIDDTVSAILSNGKSSGLAVSPKAQWLTWTSSKPTDSTGVPILDDVGEVKVRVSGIGPVLEITNIINDITYITPQFFNRTTTRVELGVYDGSTVSCASVLLGASGTVNGFTKLGYYRLLAATEIRAYRDASHCTGPYVSWPSSQLAGFSPKSGLVTLTLTAAP
jgi:hypothetical protein